MRRTTHRDNETITAQDFLQAVFPAADILPDDTVVLAKNLGERGWRNIRWRPDQSMRRCGFSEGTAPWYFCASTCRVTHDGPQKRRLQDVQEAWVVPCDDIGTKAAPAPLEPSYLLETSAGNYQAGYLIQPFAVDTPAGRHAYDTILYSLAQAGYNDPGCRSASRMLRLPGSLHGSGFVARVVQWAPERVFELEEILPAVGAARVEPAQASGGGLTPGAAATLGDVQDPVLDWLRGRGLISGVSGQWVHLLCPWHKQHTDGRQSPTGTSYSPLELGTAGRTFNCLHAHCLERTTGEFLAWVAEQGGPDARHADIDTDYSALLGAALGRHS